MRKKKLSSISKIILVVILFITSFFICKQVYDWFADIFYTECIDYYKLPKNDEDVKVHESHYDYTLLAESITQNCSSDYEKIRAIYKWLCDNIEYDTNYKIYHADKCYDERKGVCQAYCELFYYIAKAVGVRSEIVSGNTRDNGGLFSEKGHAWIFAYTRKNHGILLDPTWGAGSVDSKKFIRCKNCWHWFNVPPEWMILRHFPNEEEYQLIDAPLSLAEFKKLSCVGESALDFGLDPKQILSEARKNQLALPDFYDEGCGELKIIELPREKELKIGTFYRFKIKLNPQREFALINNQLFVESDEWNYEGDGIYSIRFMPREIGELKFSLFHNNDATWYSCLSYKIACPTKQDWRNVEKYYPLSIPEIKSIENLWENSWKESGIDNYELVQKIRQENVSALPKLYNEKGQKLKIESVPMNYSLIVGQDYLFSFYPESGIDWAITNNNTWYKEWIISNDNKHSMRIIPMQPGKLYLLVKLYDNDNYYWPVFEYEVIK